VYRALPEGDATLPPVCEDEGAFSPVAVVASIQRPRGACCNRPQSASKWATKSRNAFVP